MKSIKCHHKCLNHLNNQSKSHNQRKIIPTNHLNRFSYPSFFYFLPLILMGGGNLLAIEANKACANGNTTDCIINTPQDNDIKFDNLSNINSIIIETTIKGENTYDFTKGDDVLYFEKTNVTNFVNKGQIINQENFKKAIKLADSSTINSLTNEGLMLGSIVLSGYNGNSSKINNFINKKSGEIYGIFNEGGGSSIGLLNNYGSIYLEQTGESNKLYNFKDISMTIGNYAMKINEDSNTFNNFSGYEKNSTTNGNITPNKDTSHLVFHNANDKITLTKNSFFLLNFGGKFELNKDYSLDKLITDISGNKFSLKYENGNVNDLFSHLHSSDPIYTISRNGNYFRANIDGNNGISSRILKPNIKYSLTLLSHSNSLLFNNKKFTKKTNKKALSNLEMEYNNYLALTFKNNQNFYYSNEFKTKSNMDLESSNNVNHKILNSKEIESKTKLDSMSKKDSNVSSDFSVLADSTSNLASISMESNNSKIDSKLNINLDFISTLDSKSSLKSNVNLDSKDSNNKLESNILNNNLVSTSLDSNTIYIANVSDRQQARERRTIINDKNNKNNSSKEINIQNDRLNIYSNYSKANNYNNPTNQSSSLDSNNKNPNSNLAALTSNQSANKIYPYYFFFSPFVSYNMFYNDGLDYKGLDYGFISGFNASINNANTLGLHLGFSYGKLKSDNASTLSTMSLMTGIHYKLDLVYNMYLKARGDFFYFLNDLSYLANNIKPNNIAFSASLYYGKDFDFKEGGIFGAEIGFNYLGMNTNEFSFESTTYTKSLINLIYTDININYTKLFENNIYLNSALGFKYLFNNPVSSFINNTITYDFNVGADKYIGYVELGLRYNINNIASIDLNYIGNFGNKSISHSGFFNVRVWW